MKHVWLVVLVTIIFLICFMAGYVWAEIAYAEPDRATMEDYARRTAELFELSPELVLAVIDQESSWRITCKSSAGCLGLMQLNPNTGKWCCEQMNMEWLPFDYQTNIACGCYYLRYLYDEWMKFDVDEENVTYFVLISYNRGITGANKWIACNALETNKYANAVLEKKERLEREHYGNE